MRWLVSLAFALLLTKLALAQCAMCKANVIASGDNNLAAGLRAGILLLMAMPYLIIGTAAIAIYLAHRRSLRWRMEN
ncbi:MAG: hypothetical protein DFNUSKGM_000017 [Candidatus Fervidibacter sacchari]